MATQYKQLTLKERYQIETLSKLEFSARKMALKLERGNKTIAEELARCLKQRYGTETAHRFADEKRRSAAKHSKCTEMHKKTINTSLLLGLSPEQIAGRMKAEAGVIQ
ncbi:IS30 family transposase [Shewanella benthica]|uniref:Transposase (10) n=1 Tax=Shewanella benthica KT99 TaxID=314608 RepID=A9DEZ5_9GAMM|nr:IS30 family transposase [Shewanella benthica]EDP99954.1 transposase (10) [Shewanella benthica KT99]